MDSECAGVNVPERMVNERHCRLWAKAGNQLFKVDREMFHKHERGGCHFNVWNSTVTQMWRYECVGSKPLLCKDGVHLTEAKSAGTYKCFIELSTSLLYGVSSISFTLSLNRSHNNELEVSLRANTSSRI